MGGVTEVISVGYLDNFLSVGDLYSVSGVIKWKWIKLEFLLQREAKGQVVKGLSKFLLHRWLVVSCLVMVLVHLV